MYLNRPVDEMMVSEWSVEPATSVETNGEWKTVDLTGELEENDVSEISLTILCTDYTCKYH